MIEQVIGDVEIVTAKTKVVMDGASNKLDDVSGKTILEEVKSMIAKQTIYNNVLATKLQEALVRIEVLEKDKSQQ